MERNKTGKYFKYAIGEIILVVIGILIALQINTWNQNRIERNEEKEIISKLNQEFKKNKIYLEKYMRQNNEEMDALRSLMNLVGVSKEELNKHNLDSLFYVSLSANDIAFADNTLKNVLQSGKLNLIKDEKITDFLYQWNALAEIRKERFQKLEYWANKEFVPYLVNKISFKEMDATANLKWTGKSRLKPDYYILFNELALENYLDNLIWYQHQVNVRCKETDILIDKIIKVTSLEK